MQKCPYTKTDNKGYTNCTRGDSHIGLCQNPCPYKATSSATMQNCTTLVDKRVSRRKWRKKPKSSLIQAFFEVVQNNIEAEGVEYYA